MPGKSKKATTPVARKQLERQEKRVSLRAAQDDSGQKETEKFSRSAKVAEEYASNIAEGDEVKFIQAFQAAFNIAAGVHDETTERTAVRATLRSDVPLAPARFISDGKFVENTIKLIRDQNRIIGGVPTTDFPDCVAVGTNFQWCCTGTLVAPNVVVTAGHCQGGCSARVFFGTNVNTSGEIVPVKKAVRHPQYGIGGKHNDLTVLILERDVKTVKPRKLATTTMVDKAHFIRAVGFGNTDPESTSGYGIKRMVDIPIASVSCAADGPARYGCDAGLELVAGAPFLNKDSCNGDSGGPIYVKSGTAWYLAGATSRATVDSTRPCGDGGIYVRIDKYATWIRSVSGGHWS
jgi:trypsin